MNNKILIILILFFLTTVAFGQVIDQPVVRVEYDSVDVITEKVLEQRLKQQKNMAKMYKQSTESINRKEVAKSIIRERLLLQYARTLDIDVDDFYIDSQIDKQKKMIEQQINREISNKEFMEVLQTQFGVTLKELKLNFKRVEIIQKLVNQEKKDFISNYPKPNDTEIERLFNMKIAAGGINNPVYVEIAHLFIDTTKMKFNEQSVAHEKIVSIKNKIEVAGKSFKSMVKKYSDDEETKSDYGKLGWTSMQDKKFLALFGEESALDIVSLNVGELSNVLESSLGFHLVYIQDKKSGGIPLIDEKIHPQSKQTYRESLKNIMNQESAQEAFLVAMEKLYEELVSDAVITYYDKELK